MAGPTVTIWLELEDKQSKFQKTRSRQEFLWCLFYKATRDVQKPYLEMVRKEASLRTKLVEMMEFQLKYFKS